jgi:hypothetical protein
MGGLNLSTSSPLALTLTATGLQAVTGPPSPGIDEDFRGRLLARDRDLAAQLHRQGNALIQRRPVPGRRAAPADHRGRAHGGRRDEPERGAGITVGDRPPCARWRRNVSTARRSR